MTAETSLDVAAGDALVTIDELAAGTGMTVRNTRYYASLGLLPAPERRGRMAYYGPIHVGRIQLIKALQEHGFTLAAIERYLADVPMTASAEELSVQRALLTAWRPDQWEVVDRAGLDHRAGRRLDAADLDWLTTAGALRHQGPEFHLAPSFRLAVELHAVNMPLEAITGANNAVRRHMSQLADELTAILREQVLSRYDLATMTADEATEFESLLTNLRTLTLDAIVGSFQRAASQLAAKALSVPDESGRDD